MHTIGITTKSFASHVDKEGIVFIDWWASWCGPCRAFAPAYEKTAAAHPDVTWGKVDTEAEPELAGAFAIRAIPTLMVFRDGVLLFEQAGMVPAKALEELLTQVKALDMDEVRQKIVAQASAATEKPGAEKTHGGGDAVA